MTRNYNNTSAATALNGGVNDSVTTWTVDDGSTYPAVPFAARCEDEVVLVTAKSGTLDVTWTVERGYDGTTGATHADATAVDHVVIADDMAQIWAGRVAGPLPSYDATSSILWDGTDSSGMTTVTVSGAQTITEGVGQIGLEVTTPPTVDDFNALLSAQSFSVSDEWMCSVVLMSEGGAQADTTASHVGICFTDGTTGAANAVTACVQASGAGVVLVGRHGTLTSMGTAPWVSDSIMRSVHGRLWVKLIYQASNSFRLAFSMDGVVWSTFGESDISKTMTPTHVGLTWSTAISAGATDTVLMSYGPLLKT